MQALASYRHLSTDQQGALLRDIKSRLRDLIGRHGDIEVLVEYISVMLQSEKQWEVIEQELEAFLQEQTRPFVTWLSQQLEVLDRVGNESGPGFPPTACTNKLGGGGSASVGNQTKASSSGRTSTRHVSNFPDENAPSEATVAVPTRTKNGVKRSLGGLGANLLRRAVRDATTSKRSNNEDTSEERRTQQDASSGSGVSPARVVPIEVRKPRKTHRRRVAASDQQHRLAKLVPRPSASPCRKTASNAAVVAAAAAAASTARDDRPRKATGRSAMGSSSSAALVANAVARLRAGVSEKKSAAGTSARNTCEPVLKRRAVTAASQITSALKAPPVLKRRRCVGTSSQKGRQAELVTAKVAALTRKEEDDISSCSYSRDEDEEEEMSADSCEEVEPPSKKRRRRKVSPNASAVAAAAADGVAAAASSRSKLNVSLQSSPRMRIRAAAAIAAITAAAESASAFSPRRGDFAATSVRPLAAKPRRPAPAATRSPVVRPAPPSTTGHDGSVATAVLLRRAAAVNVVDVEAQNAAAASSTRWHFQAQAASEVAPAPQRGALKAPGPSWPAPRRPQSFVPTRPKGFAPQKWRVAAETLVVGASEKMDSQQVRILSHGEIVESVGPPFTLPSGVVRVEIAHPSSAAYPNPIGWASHDESAAGGIRCLEPGPQPVQAGIRNAIGRMTSMSYGGGGWRPRPAYRSYRPRSAGFTNLTWRPTPGT